MHLRQVRDRFFLQATLSRLFIDVDDGKGELHFGFVLEDRDRGLSEGMPLEELKARKQRRVTAIPTGTFDLFIRWSGNHSRHLLGLQHVPAFRHIEIHPGNWIGDTDGCLLPGLRRTRHSASKHAVYQSQAAVGWLEETIMPRLRAGERVPYIIERDAQAWAGFQRSL